MLYVLPFKEDEQSILVFPKLAVADVFKGMGIGTAIIRNSQPLFISILRIIGATHRKRELVFNVEDASSTGWTSNRMVDINRETGLKGSAHLSKNYVYRVDL